MKDKKVSIYVFRSIDECKDDNLCCDDGSDDDFNETLKSALKTPKPVVVKPKIPISKKFKVIKGTPITDIMSLINSLKHPKASKDQKEFVEVLHELNNMIGMNSFKEQLINQILFFIQDYQEPGIFLHTVLTGPPGAGKTMAANILAKIYSKLGLLATDRVVIADRSSLIAQYLGQTAIKTKNVLESAKGCVLLIDEVYSLGNKESGDLYSKECIDTINQYLSEHVDDFICIIAGYKDQVQECFFNNNPGLERRFPWKFTIEKYKPDELFKIMKIQLANSGWSWDIEENYMTSLIKDNIILFTGNGGDTKNLIDKCKIVHARRMFTEIKEPICVKKRKKGSDTSPSSSPNFGTQTSRVLNKDDILTGLKHFMTCKEKKEDTSAYMNSMYI